MAGIGNDILTAPDGHILRSFTDRGPVIAFIKDDSGRYLYINPAMEAVFGVTLAEVHGQEADSWLPPDLARTAREQDAEVLATGRSVEALEAVTTGKGTQYWRVVRFTFSGADGRRFVGGLAMDVTDLQHTQTQLAENERRYRHLVESGQGLICTHDMEGRLLTVNQAALTLTGLTPEQVIGKNLREVLSPTSRDVFSLYLERMQHVGMDAGLMFVRAANGRELAWQYRNVKVEEPGHPPYVLGHAQDVTELRDAQEQLRQLAMTDDLTGLHNRRGFLVNGSRLLFEAVRQHKGAAVFYADIDGLKGINDSYGHDAGSALIVAAADVLKNSFRAADLLGRIGGDEFVALVIVPPDDIETITRRLHWHLHKFNASAGVPYVLSMSMGVVHYSSGGEQTLEDLIGQADAEMYRHKRPPSNAASPDGAV